MNSRARATTLFLILLVAWGSLLASPFRAFAEMCRDLARMVIHPPHADEPTSTILVYGFALVVLIAMLVLSRGKVQHFVAPFAALAALAYNLILSMVNGGGFTIALTTSIGLALALLFLLPKSQRPAMWLGDAFTMAIPAMVVFDAIVVPGAAALKIGLPHVKDWLDWPSSSLIHGLDGFLGLNVLLWGLIVLSVFLVPAFFLVSGRQKG